MKYISDDEYCSLMKKIEHRNEQKERVLNLKKERDKYKFKIKLPSTSKLILIGAVLLCLEIIIFAEFMMFKLHDLSAMYALIGIPVALVPIIWGYYSKAKAENTQGGITYDMAMAQLNMECESNLDDDCSSTGENDNCCFTDEVG